MKKNLKFILFIVIVTIIALIVTSHPALAAINLNINSNTSNTDSSGDSASSSNSSANTFESEIANDLSNSNNNTSSDYSQTPQQQYGNELDTVSTSYSNTSTVADSSAADVYSLNSVQDSEVNTNLIINILLIAVGFILILLGIAVLIRLKK